MSSNYLFSYFNNYFYSFYLIKKLIRPCLKYYFRQSNKNKKFPSYNLLIISLFLILLSLFPYKNEANINNIQRRHNPHPFAQGNLFVVFNAYSGRSSPHSPQLANLSALWCQATTNLKDQLKIKEARFVRDFPKPERIHEARYNSARTRAFLDFDSPAPISSIGKYRCEITLATEENEEKRPKVNGNLFVYMRPVLILNSTTRLDHKEEGNYFAWIGSAKTAQVGDDVIIECPADAYPLPVIQWFKDEKPLNTSALLPIKDKRKPSNRLKYILTPKALTIRSVNSEDEATYKCLATNSFQLQYHESPREFQLTLEHYLRIPSKMSWIIPLLVIITSLLLLVLIIWACSRHDHNKSNQYNVAQKEKEHFRSKKAPTDAEDELDD